MSTDNLPEEPTFRDLWESMTADERRSHAPEPHKPCINKGCDEPAGTPWGPYWCADHDDERMNRIASSLKEIAGGMS